jgi:hypothetical protein
MVVMLLLLLIMTMKITMMIFVAAADITSRKYSSLPEPDNTE